MNYGGLVVVINYAGSLGGEDFSNEMLFLNGDAQLFLDVTDMQFLGA